MAGSAVRYSGEKKTNKHKQLRGIVPEMGGGRIVYVFPLFSGKKKAHKHKLFCLVGPSFSPDLSQGQIQFVPGTNPVKNWDKPRNYPYSTQWKPDFTGLVPGTNPVCPWDNPGDEGRHRKFM